jgi:hypothetical protein
MIRHLILPTIAAAALAASTASAMPARDAGRHAQMSTHGTVLVPARVDAAAHAATIRAIGARLLAD